jgi:hypothetical protein
LNAAALLALVEKAIHSGLGNTIHWTDKAAERVRNDANLCGYTPEEITALLVNWARSGNRVRQRPETRANWAGVHDYVYEAEFAVAGLRRDLYIEMRVKEPIDQDVPEIWIVNSHLTSFF